MGAVSTKSKGTMLPNNIPCCSECSSICQSSIHEKKAEEKYHEWSDIVRSKNGTSRAQCCSVVDNNKPLQSAKTFSPDSLSHDFQKSMPRFSLSFAGDIPDDWTEEDQNKLQFAVAEVARRSRLRFPGHKEMRVELPARIMGRRESSMVYGKRYFLDSQDSSGSFTADHSDADSGKVWRNWFHPNLRTSVLLGAQPSLPSCLAPHPPASSALPKILVLIFYSL
jgi:hypothetical protein